MSKGIRRGLKMIDYSCAELRKAEESLLSQIHPAVVLETILFVAPSVQFKTRLPDDVLVEVFFAESNKVKVNFPRLTVPGTPVCLERHDIRSVTLVKLKDLLCGITAPQRRLLKLNSLWTGYLKTWRQATPYLKRVNFEVQRAYWDCRKNPRLASNPPSFGIQGSRILLPLDVVQQAELQWCVCLFNECYGGHVIQKWEEFCAHYPSPWYER